MILSQFCGILLLYDCNEHIAAEYCRKEIRCPKPLGAHRITMKKTVDHHPRALESLSALVNDMTALYADNVAFTWRDPAYEDGTAYRTYADTANDIKCLATYLCAMGLEGKHIALVGKNSYLWMVSYLAITAGCGVVVPLDRELRADEISDLLLASDCSAVLYGEDMQDKLGTLDLPTVLRLPLSGAEMYLSYGQSLRDAGSRAYENHITDPDALSVLLYTTGGIDTARGIMLSQRNICADITGICSRVRFTETDKVLSHLPMHAVYECTADLAMLYSGAGIAISDGMRRMPADLSHFRPTVLITVPAMLDFMSRFITDSYAHARGGRILLGVQKAATGFVTHTVGTVARSAAEKSRRGIFSTVHTFLGGRLRAIFVGAAPLSAQIHRRFEQYGYAVYVGYGLTETAPVALMHHDRYRSADDIGFPIPALDVRIDSPDEHGIGELCIKGPTVMLGYYKNEEATATVLRDGWLHTGDLACMTETGSYRITGRKKSMIVLPTGKKIFPEELESYLTRDPFIAEALVYAEEQDGNQILCASVYPDISILLEALSLPSDANRTQFTEAQHRAARDLLLDVIRRTNADFPIYKHIKKLLVRTTPFPKNADGSIIRSIQDMSGVQYDSVLPKHFHK